MEGVIILKYFKMIKYLLFDVSGTLLYKPKLISKISEVLNSFGYFIPKEEISYKHKLLTEITDFPDRTNSDFYRKFNSSFLYLIGIIPNDKILNKIYEQCSYLKWDKYDDTHVLNSIDLPMGIISNFNSSLNEKLNYFFNKMFSDIFISEEIGISKPDINFYKNFLKTIEYEPDQILYIGDSIRLDIEPSVKLGMKSVLIDRDGFYSKSDLIINNLEEVKKFI